VGRMAGKGIHKVEGRKGAESRKKRYKWHVVEKILTNIFLSSSPPQNKTS